MTTTRAPGAAGESARLRRVLDLALPVLFASGRRLFTDPRIAELYPEYLFATHAIIRASVPLMEAARERAEALGPDDRVAAIVASYLAEHIEEERDHDEWLLEDMAVLGLDRETILARPPSSAVAALVGAQYYWALHYHPVAILGYIALLEGYPITDEEVGMLAARTGFPQAAFRTLAKHAELDPGHGAELDEVLDRLAPEMGQQEVMGMSALASVRMMTSVIDEILERVPAATRA